MRLKPLIKGLSTYIPGMNTLVEKRGSGGTDSAAYCYGVWFKHLTLLWENGLKRMPSSLAELGPGASIGVGLAALLSGVNTYYALDVVKYAKPSCNLTVFERLVDLFTQRTARPTKGWPDFDRYLDSNLFPGHILTEDILQAALAPERIEAIRQVVLDPNFEHEGITIKYVAPWNDPRIIQKASIEVILSHSVLEHVDDLDATYRACALWLESQGWMSHQIDFSSHGSADTWNGHWAYSEWVWKIMMGRRPYLINRQPCSTHIALLKKHGYAHSDRKNEKGVRTGEVFNPVRYKQCLPEFKCSAHNGI